MLLYIVRHGIAIDRADPKCPSDPERYLTAEGLKKTREVARGFAELADKPDLFLSSPYVRALQTAEIFADALGVAKSKIEKTEALLPGAEAEEFLGLLAKRKVTNRVVCFGHAPHLDELIAHALNCNHDLTELKKAGAAAIELKRLHPPAGTLVWLLTPKALRKIAKQRARQE
ncbi:MAG TPA: phosphohistidine phosphatase SixA [Dongiaceae bacterium]|nr:phosphohistidine phosphatase SixA [Dongiaceae bacterium]